MHRDSYRPGPPVDIAAEPAGDRWTLRFVRELRHAPETVWAALTDPARLREWAPFLADRDLGAPGAATLTLVDGDTAVAHPATVRRAEPPHRVRRRPPPLRRTVWSRTPPAAPPARRCAGRGSPSWS
ncbi:SRPBCC domain-containing protein [Micromonospora sp. URMC 105]|uniref:SRPBCC domain-containing protein n=1 Tax=Micromonospora sp. URMC 105 TaxID=3423413 RepID=UPI003F1AB25D